MKAHTMECGDYWCSSNRNGHRCVLGIVRCPDGDMNAWAAGLAQIRDWSGMDADQTVDEPAWGWWRMNPDPTRYYDFLLMPAPGPGRGNFRGAEVAITYQPAAVVGAGTSGGDRG